MYEKAPSACNIDIAAAAIHGCVTREWLLEIGLTRRRIAGRIKDGRLFPIHSGVYAVGRPLQTEIERAAAAVLACGDHAALGRLSALAAWGMPGPGWPRTPVVLIGPGARRRRPNIEIHTSATLSRRDVRRHQGIRVTSPARTLLDCASLLTPKQFRRAAGHALRTKLVRRSQLADVLGRNPRHRGADALRPLIDTEPGANPTRSPLEDDFVTFCAAYDLPVPITCAVIAGYEVDAYFPAERLIVEIDSREYHLDLEAFEGDRERDVHHLALGLATVRLTHQRLRERPHAEADRLRRILADRRLGAA